MCIICLEINNERMRPYDIRLALTELSSVIPPEHAEELKMLADTMEQEETT